MGFERETASPPDDYELMRRVGLRDANALEMLYDRHGTLVFTLGLRILRDRGETEEFVSDVFLEIWRRAERYDAARGAPITYLVTLARSRAIDRHRSAAHRATEREEPENSAQSIQPVSPAADPSRKMARDERAEEVRQAMQRLDPQHRQALELAFFEGLSHTQVAQRLKRPLGTVKTYIRQGLIQLRDFLRND